MFWFCASAGKGTVRAISSFLNGKQMNVALNLGGELAFCRLNGPCSVALILERKAEFKAITL